MDAPTARSGCARRWRGVVLLAPVAAFAFVLAGIVAGLALAWPGIARRRAVGWIRFWGRAQLALLGVRLSVSGREHLDRPGPKVVVINHGSLLDVLVLAALCPERPLAVYKRELGRMPGVGWAFRALGMIAVDRGRHELAVESLRAAARRLVHERGTVLISPEGTRSASGRLGPFKLGAFHLAAASGAPIVPVLLLGVHDVLPPGSLVARAGTLRVECLAPIDTSDWSEERVREHAAEVRAVFLRHLEAAPGT